MKMSRQEFILLGRWIRKEAQFAAIIGAGASRKHPAYERAKKERMEAHAKFWEVVE
jgi:hypothetical protein